MRDTLAIIGIKYTVPVISKIRKAAGLTQEEIAEILHTKKSNISRLENVHSKVSPKLSTIEAYAKAAGYKIEVKFTPQTR